MPCACSTRCLWSRRVGCVRMSWRPTRTAARTWTSRPCRRFRRRARPRHCSRRMPSSSPGAQCRLIPPASRKPSLRCQPTMTVVVVRCAGPPATLQPRVRGGCCPLTPTPGCMPTAHAGAPTRSSWRRMPSQTLALRWPMPLHAACAR